MSVLKLTSENFEQEVLQNNETVLVDFYADWCGPCKMMAPVIDAISQEMKGKVKIGKIDVDDNQDIARKYQIMSIPTMIVFKNGKPTKTFVGARNKAQIINELK